jgi:heme-degrading monooxygenase HmoA
MQEYLDRAKNLKPVIESIDGFIDNERFSSMTKPGWVLSNSTWRDEKALIRWRTIGEHHHNQEQSRDHVFDDYRIRICEVMSDTQPPVGISVVEQRFDVTAITDLKWATLTEITIKSELPLTVPNDVIVHVGLCEALDQIQTYEVYESITNPGKYAILAFWIDLSEAEHWIPQKSADTVDLRNRRERVIRD